MPGRNGTGPMGEGAMTGRRMGRCANRGVKPTVDQPEDLTPRFGMGRGLGKGMGRGAGMRHRNGFGHNN